MFNPGDYVCHKKFPEEFGLGIVKENDGNGKLLVLWEDEFGEQFEAYIDESEVE